MHIEIGFTFNRVEPIFVFINEFVVEGALAWRRYCDCRIQFSMQIDEGV